MKQRFLVAAPWIGAGVAFVAHVACIRAYPWNFAYDGFQRWAGRDLLLVQGWLPATQVVIWAVTGLGGHLVAVRVALSMVACLGAWFGVRLAGHLGGAVAAGAMVVAAAFGPFTVWTSTLYQEGTFLCLLFAGLGMAGEGRWLAADLLMGALGLTRYEGWPYVILYVLWRREPKAGRALWGVAFWLILYGILGFRGGQPSPVNIDDWEGLGERFRPVAWMHDLRNLGIMSVHSGAYTWLALAALSLRRSWSRPQGSLLRLLAAMLAAQLGITALWLVGLGDAISRMQVVPGMLAALLAAPGVALWWERPVLRWLGIGAGLWLLGVGLLYSHDFVADFASDDTTAERALIDRMSACPSCVWWVEPRAGFGPRDRHDSCELLQGLSELRHGEDFWCSRWIPETEWEERKSHCTGMIRWVRPVRGAGHYEMEVSAREEAPNPAVSP